MEKKRFAFSAKEMGARIATRRRELRLTQEEAAELAGVSPQFFSNVETAAKNIRAENVVRVARALRTSTDYLLTGKSGRLDAESIASMLQKLDGKQLRCAEEIIKNLLVACGKA